MNGRTRPAAIGPAVTLALGLALLSLDPTRGLAQSASGDSGSQGAASILADQVRAQGHHCDKPLEAHVDPDLSLPGQKAWILTCSNATYSIQLRPGKAAQIDQLSEGQ
ncbi:MAG TPA: hypothetical protein VHA10_07100 [Hypericibacter adhaerens]|jgi:hypothetical protein|uniref:Uncharacterized protein n=1 Tax=Hypericibacter adhaerens TaxID=2602016 RepID=A0A5J6MT83_9PROT|nr:hypothetical protein [Hypericibacter adhaerens]QEX20808.1 hypothetical protein FRZ61_07280 [Hypericibacter adhaerens]HWA42960.1 hypothetical protein [Hypericibacter adhaerens]HWA79138.1 hypothetical protein [Acetobacteraceae bacterium]